VQILTTTMDYKMQVSKSRTQMLHAVVAAVKALADTN